MQQRPQQKENPGSRKRVKEVPGKPGAGGTSFVGGSAASATGLPVLAATAKGSYRGSNPLGVQQQHVVHLQPQQELQQRAKQLSTVHAESQLGPAAVSNGIVTNQPEQRYAQLNLILQQRQGGSRKRPRW